MLKPNFHIFKSKYPSFQWEIESRKARTSLSPAISCSSSWGNPEPLTGPDSRYHISCGSCSSCRHWLSPPGAPPAGSKLIGFLDHFSWLHSSHRNSSPAMNSSPCGGEHYNPAMTTTFSYFSPQAHSILPVFVLCNISICNILKLNNVNRLEDGMKGKQLFNIYSQRPVRRDWFLSLV